VTNSIRLLNRRSSKEPLLQAVVQPVGLVKRGTTIVISEKKRHPCVHSGHIASGSTNSILSDPGEVVWAPENQTRPRLHDAVVPRRRLPRPDYAVESLAVHLMRRILHKIVAPGSDGTERRDALVWTDEPRERMTYLHGGVLEWADQSEVRCASTRIAGEWCRADRGRHQGKC
jgi:hypothetical protein